MELWREELYHHGIKGQKWGIRRYQNSDGTLTAEGTRRHAKDGGTPKDWVKQDKKITSRRAAVKNATEIGTLSGSLASTKVIYDYVLKKALSSAGEKGMAEAKNGFVKGLSPREIQKEINKIRGQKEFKRLRSETINRGKSMAYSILMDVGTKSLTPEKRTALVSVITDSLMSDLNHGEYGSADGLRHHGIKGQKWGIRRYQNPDGTLTEEGQRRYAKGGGTPEEWARQDKKVRQKRVITAAAIGVGSVAAAAAISKVIRANSSDKKSVTEMSTEDIKKEIERMKTQKEYKALKAETERKGTAMAEEVLKNVGVKALTQIGTGAVVALAAKLLNSDSNNQINAAKYIPSAKDKW